MVEFHTFYVDVFTIQIKLIFITILYIFDMIPTIYILVATYYSFLSHTKSLHIFKKLYASRYEAFETLLKRTFWGLKEEKMKPLFYIGKTYVMTRTEKTRFFLFFFFLTLIILQTNGSLLIKTWEFDLSWVELIPIPKCFP